MKKLIVYIIVFSLAFVMISQIKGYASPSDINNLKKYDFENPKEQSKNYSLTKNIFTFFIYLILLILIGVLAFLTTRWLSKYNLNHFGKSKYMQIVDSLSLGNNRNIFIIKAPQGFIMIGSSEKSINFLAKFEENEAKLINEMEEIQNNLGDKTFSGYLGEFLKKRQKNIRLNETGDKK